jgi:pimeloyl-ACP methyl ester carboxylesterase
MTLRDRSHLLRFPPRAAVRFSMAVLIAGVTAVATLSANGRVFAQAEEKQEEVVSSKPVEKNLRTDDGWQIATTYYPSTRGQESPVVILLHGRQDDRLVWLAEDGFAQRLQNEGYAVIAVDLRTYGKSQNIDGKPQGGKLRPDDYRRMVTEDLRVVKDFLMEEHQAHKLNVRKTAIVAPEFSAPIAMAFAVADWEKPPYDDAARYEDRTPRGQDVRAIVFISPELAIPGVPSASFISQVRNPDWNIAFMTIYATGDKLDKGDAKRLYQKLTLTNEKEKNVRSHLQTYPVSLRGTKILDADTDMEAKMLAFLKIHLKELDESWKNRKSPLQP